MKSTVSVMPRIVIAVAGIEAGQVRAACAAAIEKAQQLTDAELGKLVRESLSSQPAIAYPMDFAEVISSED